MIGKEKNFQTRGGGHSDNIRKENHKEFIRLKKEIVTFRSKSVDPENITAKHVNEKEWNMLIDDNKTIVVYVRNDF